MALTWVATEARTGRVIERLPELVVASVGARIGTFTTTIAKLPLPTAPTEWLRATKGMASILVLLDDPEDGTPATPLWGGIVTRRPRTGGDVIEMSLKSLEAYLDLLYTGTKNYVGVGQNLIIADLIETRVADSLPIRVVYDGPGIVRDRSFADADDKTILSVLTLLSGVIDGPEWTIGWEHQADPERYTPVLYVGGVGGASRIGVSAPAGLMPNALFEMPGSVTDVELDEDYSAGRFATDVMAVSSGIGTARPESPHQIADDPDRLRVEYRFTPSTSITEIDTLTSHAAAKLAVMRDGATPLSLTAVVSEAPRLNRDWSIGDDVAYRIGAHVADESRALVSDVYTDIYTDIYGARALIVANPAGKDSVPAFPGGLYGVARAVGWDMTFGDVPKITPILATDDEES